MIRFLERHRIPYFHLDATKEDKGEGDILSVVKDTDFLVLARYMQVKGLKLFALYCILLHL